MSNQTEINDTGERILPAQSGETSIVYSRHKFAYECVKQFVAGKVVLDVGCGSGYGCNIFSKSAQMVYGIDQSSEAIEYCSKNSNAPNIEFIQMDGNKIELSQKFDVITTFQAIEHMDNLDHYIEQLLAATKPGGKIFITTPNVIKKISDNEHNPFHVNEMNYDKFYNLINGHFTTFDIIGVAYANRNRLRTIVAKSPIYKWGKKLKRNSALKNVAVRAMDLTSFKIITKNVKTDAADLMAVCSVN
jgi:2-polyprenyl-3-methyl-5-hydroxy-6-metoxy-1,4-benzoquinol methylase